MCHKASRPKPPLSVGFDMVLFSVFIPLLPVHAAVFDHTERLPFSDSSPSTAVVKFTSKFKWRLALPALNLFPLFQTSTVKIYSVGDKQDAAALEPWRSWKLTSVSLIFSDEAKRQRDLF